MGNHELIEDNSEISKIGLEMAWPLYLYKYRPIRDMHVVENVSKWAQDLILDNEGP